MRTFNTALQYSIEFEVYHLSSVNKNPKFNKDNYMKGFNDDFLRIR